MSDLPKQLRIKAGMIHMGERIAWGSDTALMEEAANLIEQQQAEIDALKAQKENLLERLERESKAGNRLVSAIKQYVHETKWVMPKPQKGDNNE